MMIEVYKVILDCNIAVLKNSSSVPRGAIGFYSINFVLCDSAEKAAQEAFFLTKDKMKKKGYSAEEIDVVGFEVESNSKLDSDDTDHLVTDAFVYYNVDD